MIMKNGLKATVSLILTCALFIVSIPLNVKCSDRMSVYNLNVNNEASGQIRIINYGQDGNIYISLRDVSDVMKSVGKQISVNQTKKNDETNIVIDFKDYVGGEDIADTSRIENAPENISTVRGRLLLTVNGRDYYIYVMTNTDEDGVADCYMNFAEFGIVMNMETDVDGNNLYINTKNEFDVCKDNIVENEFYMMSDSAIVGDASTGNIYYSNNEDTIVAIASTTKLMTYLVIKDAIARGEISESDRIAFSKKAYLMSESSDGVLPVEEGMTAPMDEVLKGMLICSSNECAIALAEHLCGDEDTFVEKMNAKAKEIGLSNDVKFYNSNGLPYFDGDVFNVKHQNQMTANDMFILASHILDKYPEITDITSIKKTHLPSFENIEVKNTNVLLYNVPECVGLKTGTTDKAQYCLVSASKVDDKSGKPHYIIAVVYGAESTFGQNYTSLVLMKYGLQKFNAKELGKFPEKGDENYVPTNLNELVNAVISTASGN